MSMESNQSGSRVGLLVLAPVLVFFAGVFDRPAVHLFLDRFDAALSGRDVRAVAECLDPSFVYGFSDPLARVNRILDRREYLARITAGTLAESPDAGRAGKVRHAERDIVVGEGTAVVDCRTYCAASRLKNILCRMALERHDGRWRIVSITETAAPFH
jgi:hypothetical protein